MRLRMHGDRLGVEVHDDGRLVKKQGLAEISRLRRVLGDVLIVRGREGGALLLRAGKGLAGVGSSGIGGGGAGLGGLVRSLARGSALGALALSSGGGVVRVGGGFGFGSCDLSLGGEISSSRSLGGRGGGGGWRPGHQEEVDGRGAGAESDLARDLGQRKGRRARNPVSRYHERRWPGIID